MCLVAQAKELDRGLGLLQCGQSSAPLFLCCRSVDCRAGGLASCLQPRHGLFAGSLECLLCQAFGWLADRHVTDLAERFQRGLSPVHRGGCQLSGLPREIVQDSRGVGLAKQLDRKTGDDKLDFGLTRVHGNRAGVHGSAGVFTRRHQLLQRPFARSEKRWPHPSLCFKADRLVNRRPECPRGLNVRCGNRRSRGPHLESGGVEVGLGHGWTAASSPTRPSTCAAPAAQTTQLLSEQLDGYPGHLQIGISSSGLGGRPPSCLPCQLELGHCSIPRLPQRVVGHPPRGRRLRRGHRVAVPLKHRDAWANGGPGSLEDGEWDVASDVDVNSGAEAWVVGVNGGSRAWGVNHHRRCGREGGSSNRRGCLPGDRAKNHGTWDDVKRRARWASLDCCSTWEIGNVARSDLPTPLARSGVPLNRLVLTNGNGDGASAGRPHPEIYEIYR
eukprot:m.151749 g.151749  ORF g.151749 m.151749 type:complete len:443 (+) comp23361_c0_seq1:119-1447(+)